jgi:hypothetical protein
MKPLLNSLRVLCGILIVTASVSCGGSKEGEAAAAAAQSPYAPLLGRWQRIDGDYILAINRVDTDGTADAAYFNPRPIRVSRARASAEGQKLELFVELRDAGYPGCTYKLAYDKAGKKLAGVYFQVAQQQSYDVEFVREDQQ